MRAMTKSQLAQAAGVSRKTLMNWLKDPYIRDQMACFQLSPHQKKLPGNLIKIICEHYVIDLD
jgi:predicted site-specific integrase-resolvase